MCLPAIRTALVCCLLLWQSPAAAIERINVEAQQWQLNGTAAEQFDLSLQLTAGGLKLTATADQLVLPSPLGTLHNVSLHCDTLQLKAGQWQCQSGRAAFSHARLGQQNFDFSVKATPASQDYQLTVEGLKLAESQMTLSGDYRADGWTLSISAKSVSPEALSSWLPVMLSETQQAKLADWSYQGRLDFDGRFEGNALQLQSYELNWQARALSYSNSSGSQAAENVTVAGNSRGQLQQDRWQWQLALESEQGQAYSDPIFLDLQQHPVNIQGQGTLAQDFSALTVTQLNLRQASVLDADARLDWHQTGLNSLHVETRFADLSRLYPIWLQPFVAGSAAAKLESSGKLRLSFDWQPAGYQLKLNFENASFEDQQQRYALNKLNGEFGWSTTDKPLKSSLQWASAKLYEIDLGAASFEAHSSQSQLHLEQSLRLPVLDGGLEISAFRLGTRAGPLNWQFEGLLTPISMQRLTAALGWPPLDGKLSGVIPTVTYQDEELKIDGALQLKIFDGTTVIRDLRMSSPFGRLPQLYANVDIRNLDLALLTTAFDFGRISGKLDGYVHHLRLSNWEPVQFDARLATPEQDPGKRRISQSAVDNLTELGGGPTGMVSRGFLGFFDDFSYQKLGWGCELKNEVCEMSGIEEAEQGYYIVKGGGGLPPWINVIGYNRRVDWAELVARLLAVREGPGPVIE